MNPMMPQNILLSIPVLLLVFLVGGCADTQTFNQIACPGETVAIAAGWKQHSSKDNITVTVTHQDVNIPPTTYKPDNPAIRAMTDFYPDPPSSLIVSRQTGQDLTPQAQTFATTVGAFTRPHPPSLESDKDWWQSTVFIDLPSDLPPGVPATIEITDPEGESVTADLSIVDGVGTKHNFGADIGTPLPYYLGENELDSLKRVDHYTITFSGTTVPYAIQIDMTHDADMDHRGIGRAYVVNPVGYIKNAAWSGDGFRSRVILTPTRDGEIKTMTDFKFYVAGGVNNLAVNNVQAFDINGE